MNCQRAREAFPELLDQRSAQAASTRPESTNIPSVQAEARAHLAGCPDCQREFATLSQMAHALDSLPAPAPSARLRQNFYAMLEEEKHSAASLRLVAAREQRARRASLWRWVLSPLAGCALLALGFFAGQRATPGGQPTGADSTKNEIAALREQMGQQREQLAQQNAQLEKMTTLVGYQILQQQQNPANDRLREVLAAASAEQPSAKVIDDLIQALTLDPNANVRLRAAQALYRHAERADVRAGVIAALPREQNPLVQLELIDFVASAQDPEATSALEKVSADERADRAVRDAAKLALAQL